MSELSKVSEAYEEFRDAQMELQIAQQNFDLAEPGYIDIAVEELRIAETRMDLVVRKARMRQGGEKVEPSHTGTH